MSYAVRLRCSPSKEDELSALLWELGTTGIIDEPGGVLAFFDAVPPLTALSDFDPQVESVEAVGWEQRTRDSFPALTIGDRFFLVAPWCDDPTPPGRLRLTITPGMACGTGWHPCTQLCLQAMETCLRPGDRVLDVGVGSGILSEAALLLGASHVVACDVDEDAVRIAKDSLRDRPADLFVGSVDALKTDRFEVVIANISAEILEDIWPDLSRCPASRSYPDLRSGRMLRQGHWLLNGMDGAA